MTAPVLIQQQQKPASERIAMTAPVLISEGGAGVAAATAAGGASAASGSHVIAFVMPSQYKSLDELPVPGDPSVRLRSVPARRELVKVLTGVTFSNEMRVAHAAELRSLAAAEGLRLVDGGLPAVAGYDPPWTLMFMRRTEVSLAVASEAGVAGDAGLAEAEKRGTD